MSTLLLRLAGPMQSWGTQSRFRERDTGREPSKSGVVGLLCAALGKPRVESVETNLPPLADLAALRMGVRVDRDGVMQVDYQTAGGSHHRNEVGVGVVKASGAPGETVVSRRYFLANASFLVGLQGDETLLARLDTALRQPCWQLSLGRKSYVPGVPVRPVGETGGVAPLVSLSLEDALQAHRWPDGAAQLRAVVETDPGPNAEVRQDTPLDFEARRFGQRHVQTVYWSRAKED